MEWPILFYTDIEFMGPNPIGDIKYSWEVARHQYVITLGKAYHLTLDEKYAETFKNHIETFIDENPPFIGHHWISALEPALRTISWIWGLAFFLHSKTLSEAFLLKVVWYIEMQAKYIDANLSIGRYANNHLIGELSALAITGMMFSGLKNARKFREKGLSHLEEQLFKQTTSDGFGKEQAYSYTRFILDFYLQVFLLADQHGLNGSAKVWQRIEKIFEFYMHTVAPNGQGLNIGDSDNARGIFLTQENYHDYRGILSLGAVLFNRGDFKYVSEIPGEEILWLKGPAGLKIYSDLIPTQPGMTQMNFPDSGYFVMRDSWDKDASYALFDFGVQGYGSCAHGHADALSFALHFKGFPVFVDPGTHNYNTSIVHRNYFRSTSAHNTITIADQDQSNNAGRMAWSDIYSVQSNQAIAASRFGFIDASHNGYSRLEKPATHQRKFFYKRDEYWLIEDRISGEANYKIDLNFHLAPSILPTQTATDSIRLGKNNKPILQLSVSSNSSGNQLQPYLYFDSIDPIRGIYSENYGHYEPAYTISFTNQLDLPAVLSSLISPVEKDAAVVSIIHHLPGFYVIRHRTGIDLLCTQKITSDKGRQFVFDGNFLFLSTDENYNPDYMYTEEINTVRIGNKVILNGKDKTNDGEMIMRNRLDLQQGMVGPDWPLENFSNEIKAYLTCLVAIIGV